MSKIDEVVYFENGKKIDKINSKVFLSAGAIQTGIIFQRTCMKNNIKISDFKTGLMDTKKVKIVIFFQTCLVKKLIINQYNLID